MAVTDIEASGSWYHLSAAKGDSASKWTEGSPRKGLLGSQENVSAILFDAAAIRTALTDADTGDPIPLQGAELILSRDTAYGESAATVTAAPAKIAILPDGYVSRAECLALCERPLHHAQRVSGAEAVLNLAGATMMALADGSADAVMLYHEEDEPADTYVKFSGTPVLRLYTDDLREPVWTRHIAQGNVISSSIYSHQADLREMVYYINLRRAADGLPDMADISGQIGGFAYWAAVIRAMQSAVSEMLNEEGAEAITWLTPGDWPEAAVIAQLREALQLTATGTTLATAAETLTAAQGWDTNMTKSAFDKSEAMTWREGVQGGLHTEGHSWISPDGQHSGSVGVYVATCGGWIFSGLNATPGVRTVGLKFTVISHEGTGETVRVTLLGIKAEHRPGSATAYNDVFDETVLGYADCAAGVESEITLTDEAWNRLAGHELYGIGIGIEGTLIVCSQTASLVANNDGETEGT